MDTVTQVVLGATIAESGFRRKLGGKAVIFGGICGLIPDLDMVVAVSGNEWHSLLYHRGISHSLPVLFAIAPLIGWLGYKWSHGKGRFWDWWHLAFWALLTHPLLDLGTSYGTQLLAPFTNKRFAVDAIAIIDPVYTLPLLIATLFAMWRKIGRKFSRYFAMIALLFTTTYLGLGYYQAQRALKLAIPQLPGKFNPVEIRAIPSLFNIWLWRIVARDAQGNLCIGMLSTLAPKDIVFYRQQLVADPLVQKTLDSKYGKIFHWFAMEMLSVELKRHTNGVSVFLHDQRYALVSDPLHTFFRARADFDSQGNLLSCRRIPKSKDIDIWRELTIMWACIWGSQK